MLTVQRFYETLIEEKKKDCEANVQRVPKKVRMIYTRKRFKYEAAISDIDAQKNRIRYINELAVVNTVLVTKFFRRLMTKKEVGKKLFFKHDIKIACLGGGPGFDVVGILKALSVKPCVFQKSFEATIYDICPGWHYSFDFIVQRLGKLLPDGFDTSNIRTIFRQVDLLEPLSEETMKSISQADIVCMVKFVSALFAKDKSNERSVLQAIQVIADLLKRGCVVLFIDNYDDNLLAFVKTVFDETGLKILVDCDSVFFRECTKIKETILNNWPISYHVDIVGCVKITTSKIRYHYLSCNNARSCTEKNNSQGAKKLNDSTSREQLLNKGEHLRRCDRLAQRKTGAQDKHSTKNQIMDDKCIQTEVYEGSKIYSIINNERTVFNVSFVDILLNMFVNFAPILLDCVVNNF